MMKSMITENGATFKKLEKIFMHDSAGSRGGMERKCAHLTTIIGRTCLRQMI